MHVYVVVENGDPYTVAYSSFAAAASVVKERHRETIEDQIREADGDPICSEVDVPENTNGTTHLYVEKGINIYIYRLPLVT
jgi:hypothetical protein